MQYLNILAIAEQQHALIPALARLASDNACQLLSSRVLKLHDNMGIMLLFSGNWSSIAKIEAGLKPLQKKFGMELLLKRSTPSQTEKAFLPYVAQMVGESKPDVLYQVSQFFNRHGLPILDLQSNISEPKHANVPMVNLTVHVGIPSDVSISEIREQLMELCDEINIDGILEPERRNF